MAQKIGWVENKKGDLGKAKIKMTMSKINYLKFLSN